MKPTNPLYYWIPDRYEMRRLACAIFGHRWDDHRRIIDFTLTEQHYIHCERCSVLWRENGDICIGTNQPGLTYEMFTPKEARRRVKEQKALL